MTGLIVFACIVLFFVLILSIRAKIILEYADELTLTVRVLGFIRIRILPNEKKPSGPHSMSAKKAKKIKEKLEKKKAKKAEKKKQKKLEKAEKKKLEAAAPKKKNGLTVADILDILDLAVSVVKRLLGTFFKHLRIRLARLRITVATGDAATTAIAYGAVTQSVRLFYPQIEKIKTVRVPELSDIHVGIDYTRNAPEIDMRLEFTLRVWHLFAVVFRTIGTAIRKGVRFLWNHMKRKDEKDAKRNKGHKLPADKKDTSRKPKNQS